MATRKKRTPTHAGPGRPTEGGPAGSPLTIRVPSEEREAWTRAAARYGASLGRTVSLSAWIRIVCSQQAQEPPIKAQLPEKAGVEKDPPLTLRVPSEERATWTTAAANYGASIGRPVSLSQWIRLVCTEAARPDLPELDKPRDRKSGQFKHTTEALCQCGHPLGMHTAEQVGGVRECLAGDFGHDPCDCERFRKVNPGT